jgi:WD40 repeat protein
MEDTNITTELSSVIPIYTSAIPFAHNSSPVAQHYRSQSSIRSQWNRPNMSTEDDYAHAISTDAARVATSTPNRLSVFSVMSGATIWVKQTSSWAGKPFFSSDGQILACTHKGRTQLFDAASGHAIKELNIRVDDYDIWHVAISPQNDYIAVVFLGHQVCIFRIEDGVMTWQSSKTKTGWV